MKMIVGHLPYKLKFSGELHDCRNRKVIREKVYKKDRAGQTAF